MAKKNEVAEVKPGAVVARGVQEQLPAHIRQGEVAGAETLMQFVRPPRVKVVQKTAHEPISTMFNTGDVILVPNMHRIAEMVYTNNKPAEQGPSLSLVPIFFFPEWIGWEPIERKGSSPAVFDRSTDPNSVVALRAKDPSKWAEKVGEVQGQPIFRRYCEHLNFVVRFLGDGMPDELCVLSFSRASHKHGSSFARILHQRKADIWGCVFDAFSKFEKNSKGDWYALNITNPAGGSPWVQDPEMYAAFGKEHEALKAAHAAGLIDVNHEDEEERPGSGGDTEY